MPAEILPKGLLRTEAGQAAVTQAWMDGHSQGEIARRVFGFKGPWTVFCAMSTFVSRFVPERHDEPYVQRLSRERAKLAVSRYLETRHAR